jgi:CRISPR-associated endonuclease Cas1
MARPRSDPFDASSLRAAIDRGETTERAAYLNYAASAGRPYARSTFAAILRQAALRRAEPSTKTKSLALDNEPQRSVAAWRDPPIKPKILSLSAGGGLRVRAGALVAFDNDLTITYSPAGKPPLAIVLSTAGGFVSMEAVRFCARANVAIVALDRAHGFLTVISGGASANAANLRAQVRADPMTVARAIVKAKIAALRRAGALASCEQFLSALDDASSLDRVRNIEAQASRVAWSNPPALRWEGGSIPPEWKAQWIMRARLDAKGKRGARLPVNAMLNAAFVVTAGRLAAYLMGLGLSPAIGFLHADKKGRWSLAWDAIEPLRPMIEGRLFRFVESKRFRADDFIKASDGSLRLAPGLLRAVLNTCAPPPHTLALSVRWMARLIASTAAEGEGKQTRECFPHNVNGLGAVIGGGGFKRGNFPCMFVGLGRERG